MTEETKVVENQAPAVPTFEEEIAAMKVGTNPLTIPWPQDQQGALAALKKGGVEAARRVNGDKEKLKKLIVALRLIEKHAKARFRMDTKSREDAKVNYVSARARVQEKLARQAEAKAMQLEKAAAELRASVK